MEINFGKKSLILILVPIAFYAAILMFSDFNKIDLALHELSIQYLAISLGLMGINIIISGYRYHISLKKIGLELKFRQSLLVFTASLSMILTPAGAGTIIKSHIIKKMTGKSFSYTSPIVFYEKWLELVSILIVISFLLLWIRYLESIIILAIGIIFAIVIFYVLKRQKGFTFLNNLITKIKFLKNLVIGTEEFSSSIDKLTEKKTTLYLLSLTILPKLNSIIIVYLIFQSFGINFDLAQSGQIFHTSQLIGFLSFVPAGVLVTESSLLGMILKQGIEFGLASISVVVIRFVTLWLATIVGFTTFWKVMK